MKLGFVLFFIGSCFAASPGRLNKISPAAASLGEMSLLVLFHPDVDVPTAEGILSAAQVKRLERPDLVPNQYLIQATLESAARLAAADEIAYVYPASEDLVSGMPVHGCMGPLVGGAEIAQYVATFGQGWDGARRGEASIGYSFSRVGSQVSQEVLTDVVQRALSQWAAHAQIRFTYGPASASRNINFVFASGAHEDSYPFDGRGRVLAHTFYPSDVTPEPLAGDIHIDEDEPWSTKIDPDLYSVILHEVGHSLGLGHSDRPGAVMYPYYRRLSDLQADDIAALQRLYAAPMAHAAAIPVAPVTPASPEPPAAPVAGDRTNPTVAITFPAVSVYSTSAATARISGSARDASGISELTWSSSTGASGVASASNNWRIEGVPLLVGDNRITVYAKDAAGNVGHRSVLITRR
jgi:hypothetical protein